MDLHKENSSQIILNKRKGRLGELIIRQIYLENSLKIITNQKGCDFVVERTIPGSSKIYQEYVEVKTGHSKQTRIQKKTMKRVLALGCNYTIFHMSDKFLESFLEANHQVVQK